MLDPLQMLKKLIQICKDMDWARHSKRLYNVITFITSLHV